MQEDKELLKKILQENTARGYTPITRITIQNFMSLKEAILEFDETNIINLKGYNDSGKSAVLRAFEVCLENKYQRDQAKFILDGETYFRIMVEFTDGTLILRDRYVNNQSLYEMYNNGTLIFSTKQNGVLTKVTKVPDVIENYIGMLHHNGVYIQSRSCFDKQFLVETSGKENAETLNIILKNEELAYATSLLNNDKNKKASDLKAKETEMNLTKQMVYDCKVITNAMLEELQSLDTKLDNADEKKRSLDSMVNCNERIKAIPDIPELHTVDTTQLATLGRLSDIIEQLSNIQDLPELEVVDTKQLDTLFAVQTTVEQLKGIQDIPELSAINTERIDKLNGILATLTGYLKIKSELEDIDTQEQSLRQELEQLETEMRNSGIKLARCENCGNLVEVEV